MTQHEQMRQMSANRVLRYKGKYDFSDLRHFSQMIFGECSIKRATQIIVITQENYVLKTFFYILAID